MAVFCFVLGTTLVLDVMAVALLAFHDVVDDAKGDVLAVVLRVTSQLSLFTLVMALVDVTVGVAVSLVLVEVGAEVAVPCAVHPRLVGVVLIDLLLDGEGCCMQTD
jgi:hypothetical protein